MPSLLAYNHERNHERIIGIHGRSVVKAYLFSTENGLYEGETFVAADMFDGNGITTLAPPPHETGMVPVFDPGQGRWVLMTVSRFRERFLEGKG